MKKLPLIVIGGIVIIAGISVALFYSQKKSNPPPTTRSSQETSPTQAAQQPQKPLPFDTNDNLDQALDDIKTLDGSGIQ